MRIAKWGNSLAVRLPASVVETLGLQEGDEIEITVAGRAASRSSATKAARKHWRG